MKTHIVHPGNPYAPEPDGIISVQRNFVAFAPQDDAFVYWGVRRPAVPEPSDEVMTFQPVVGSRRQRPAIPLSIRFAAGLMRVRSSIADGVLRFDRIESALPFLGHPLPKALFLHIWNLADVVGPRSDSRWRHAPAAYRRVFLTVVRAMDSIYVLNPHVLSPIFDVAPELEERCHPFGVSVDVSRFAPLSADRRQAARYRLETELRLSSTSKLVLFAGRLEAVKRPMMLPAIARALADDRADEPVHVIVAGAGSLGPRLERESRDGHGVHLLGPVSQDRIAELMPAVDTLVLPSGFEALPNVVLESLASGTPVVVSREAGGARELVESDGVGMVAGDTPRAFADAIRGVLAWDGRRTDRCIRTAARHTPARINASVYEGMRGLSHDTAGVGAGG